MSLKSLIFLQKIANNSEVPRPRNLRRLGAPLPDPVYERRQILGLDSSPFRLGKILVALLPISEHQLRVYPCGDEESF